MRIMHLLKHAVRGNGHVHVAVDLACAQADAGHQVWFASARGSYDELLRKHGVHVTDLPEPTGKKEIVRNAKAMLSLAARTRPDIMHAHMMSSALVAFPVSKVIGATLVTTVHNSFDGHSKLMRLGRMVIAVSEAERQQLIQRGFKPDRVVTVLNGADASPREELPRDDIGDLRRPAVLSLSGLHARKAVDDIISAFALVHPEHPEWHLNIVGWGPDREKLEAQARELGLAESVHFLGTTLTPRYLLDQADIFASASLADPCPLTTTEARGSGCALIGTTVGGVPEVLEHGKAGQLVPPRDPAALAQAMRRLMADPAELAAWRERSRTGAEHFTVARVARDHEDVYRLAMGARRRTAR
ncbi:Glycosyltransferase involved in cell wall bisynthesis [Quadrisphaera granulorum]|uniref:Glycosyltransferase involved in cell wall biosynthesis n=1 Tax=Quadrisphaera granulorum TaxID=317664 RepID=A0A316ADS3_9ACTN|nr:glycosyltransferase family 4 protein [Quadrisphaera granulorum]PWJ55120.1 glycosyltransferase involved in cell wall biosynthesis [Quadrisphaera granulorum]SZE95629.1 Glycosyltransferase involved in cell wall bisynthesis [Quadrisphaera granulorum]